MRPIVIELMMISRACLLRLAARGAAATIACWFAVVFPASLGAQADTWFRITPSITTANLWGVTFGVGTIVAVGEQGTIVTYRYDSNTWTSRNSGGTRWLTAAGFGASRFVVVGDAGTILTSDDGGASWVQRTSPTQTRLNAVAYGNGRWLAVGEQGTVLTSIDGDAWTARPAVTSGYLRGLAFGQGRFVFGGAGGALFSTVDGNIISPVPIPTSSSIEGVAITPDRFFVVGSGGLLASAHELGGWRFHPASATGRDVFRGVAVRNAAEASAVGETTAVEFVESRDAAEWSRASGEPSFFATAITQARAEMIAVGFGGAVARTDTASTAAVRVLPVNTFVGGTELRARLVSGLAPQNVQWFANGAPIAGATGSELVLPAVRSLSQLSVRFNTPAPQTISAPIQLVPGGRPEIRDPAFRPTFPAGSELIVPAPDGKVYVAGNFSVRGAAGWNHGLLRLNADGSIDPTFNAGSGLPGGERILEIIPHADGVTLRGTFTTFAGVARPQLVRLRNDGAVDPAFAPIALEPLPERILPAENRALWVQLGQRPQSTVIRLRPDGQRDPTFTAAVGHTLIATDSADRVLVVDHSSSQPRLRRLLSDGRTDPGYTPSDVTSFAGATSASDSLAIAQLTPAGLYAAAIDTGRASMAVTLRRYLPNGGLDASYLSSTISPNIKGPIHGGFFPDGSAWFTLHAGAFQTYGFDATGERQPNRYALLPNQAPYQIRALLPDGSALVTIGPAGEPTLERIRPLSGAAVRLVNLSVRSEVRGNEEPLVLGFVTAGDGLLPLLARGAGPSLAEFGVPAPLPDPFLRLFRYDTSAASQARWDPALRPSFAAVGAFPFAAGSLDAAMEREIGFGDHSLMVSSPAGANGTALAELYALGDTGFDGRRFNNLSARARVTPEQPLIAGFVLRGDVPKRLLIRGVGVTLENFGVAPVLRNLRLILHAGDRTELWENRGWNGPDTNEIAAIAQRVGAFPLTTGSDTAMLVTLGAGAYTATVAADLGDSGIALIEIYEVP